MSEDITLSQLAAEVAHLRQQLEQINQRLDMIYGAVTRLADQTGPATNQPQQTTGSQAAPAGPELSPAMMMDPDSMLNALHQYAVKAGLEVSQETVERLKTEGQSETPPGQE